jgi:hypothetical protein
MDVAIGGLRAGPATLENDGKAAIQDLYQSGRLPNVGKRALLGPFFFFCLGNAWGMRRGVRDG